MDSGLAALAGALVGGTASLIGTYLLLRHEFRTRWDVDRRTGYLEFLEVSGLLEAKLSEFADLIGQWHNGDVDGDTILVAYDEHIAERRGLANRLGVVQTQFMLYAPMTVLKAAGGVVSALTSFLSLHEELIQAERHVEVSGGLQDSEEAIAAAIDVFVRACRTDLRIPIPPV